MNKLAQFQTCLTQFVRSFNTENINDFLYQGRKIILISSCMMPVLVALSMRVSGIVHGGAIALGLISITCLSMLEISNQQDSLPTRIAHKITCFSYPLVSGHALTRELIYLTSSPIAIIAGMI